MATAKKTKKPVRTAAKKRPATKKKAASSARLTKPSTMQRTDWLVVVWLGLIALFLIFVVKSYVIG